MRHTCVTVDEWNDSLLIVASKKWAGPSENVVSGIFKIRVLRFFLITLNIEIASLGGSVGCLSDWWSGGCGFFFFS